MYYLFLFRKKDLEAYKKDFDRVHDCIEQGKTPVQNELRTARTILFEAFPYQSLSGAFLVFGTYFLDKFQVNELAKIGMVLVINNMCYAVSNYIFTLAKHWLRLRLCKRLGVSPNERNIAVMESMEYQSV